MDAPAPGGSWLRRSALQVVEASFINELAKLQSVRELRALHLYSVDILPFLVIFNADKELSLVLCGCVVCSTGRLLELLFQQFSLSSFNE